MHPHLKRFCLYNTPFFSPTALCSLFIYSHIYSRFYGFLCAYYGFWKMGGRANAGGSGGKVGRGEAGEAKEGRRGTKEGGEAKIEKRRKG